MNKRENLDLRAGGELVEVEVEFEDAVVAVVVVFGVVEVVVEGVVVVVVVVAGSVELI